MWNWNQQQWGQGPDPRPMNPPMQNAGMQPQPAGPTGANRQGYDWRQQRRDARQAGTYDPNAAPVEGDGSGAQRAGYGWRQTRRQAKKAGTYDPNAGGAQQDINVMGQQPQGPGAAPGATPWMTPLQHPMLNQMQQAANGVDQRWQQKAPAGTAPLQHNMLNNAQQHANTFDQWRQQVGQLGQQYPQFQQKLNNQMQTWQQSYPQLFGKGA